MCSSEENQYFKDFIGGAFELNDESDRCFVLQDEVFVYA